MAKYYDVAGRSITPQKYGTWRNHSCSEETGSVPAAQTNQFKVTRLMSTYIWMKKGTVIKSNSGYTFYPCYFSKPYVEAFIGSNGGNFVTSLVIPQDCYCVISIQRNNALIYPSEGDEAITIDGEYEVIGIPDTPKTVGGWAKYEKTKRLFQMWIFTGDSIYPSSGDFWKTFPLYGIWYSAQTRIEGYVGADISIYTYLSAVANPKSILYTTVFNDFGSKPYYGTDCSGFVWAGFGFHDIVTTHVMVDWEKLHEVTDLTDVRIGDMPHVNGHCRLVTDIERDKFGRILRVFVDEATMNGQPAHRCFSFDEFAATISGGYHLLRYEDYEEDAEPLYDNYPMFLTDHELDNYTFPDVMPTLGDKVNIKAGTDVLINVVNEANHTAIQVYKDGTLLTTKNTVEDFTLQSVAVGDYEIRAIGGKPSSSYFHVTDCSLTVSGNTATFTATGVTPYTISAYKQEQTDSQGNFTAFTDKFKMKFLTAEEIAAGSADVTELVEYATANNGYLKLKCYDDFGTIWDRSDR